jgi:hypothetical protein
MKHPNCPCARRYPSNHVIPMNTPLLLNILIQSSTPSMAFHKALHALFIHEFRLDKEQFNSFENFIKCKKNDTKHILFL